MNHKEISQIVYDNLIDQIATRISGPVNFEIRMGIRSTGIHYGNIFTNIDDQQILNDIKMRLISSIHEEFPINFCPKGEAND